MSSKMGSQDQKDFKHLHKDSYNVEHGSRLQRADALLHLFTRSKWDPVYCRPRETRY